MTGSELETFCEELNGGDSIGTTLLFHLINTARALVENRRPWMVLRNTDTSKTVLAGDTWQTAISLSSITNLSRFYGEWPIKLFDGANNLNQFRQVPFNQRLHYRDASDTFVYDQANETLYLNGTHTFGGTLWIDHIKHTNTISSSNGWQSFPDWSHPLLGFLAVSMHKGGVDYDEVNFRMSGVNADDATRLIRMLENWDNELQLSSINQIDPYNDTGGFRPGRINF